MREIYLEEHRTSMRRLPLFREDALIQLIHEPESRMGSDAAASTQGTRSLKGWREDATRWTEPLRTSQALTLLQAPTRAT